MSTCSTCTTTVNELFCSTLAICILSSRWSQILHILGIIIKKKGRLMTKLTLLNVIIDVI